MISRVSERGSLIYVTGLSAEPAGDVKGQTRSVLQHIDMQLALAGSDKSKLLTAQIRLSDMNMREAHDAAWAEWVDPLAAHIRSVSQGALPQPETVVEILVTARK
jgi:enamine deaminase RidA (YjgF/YER057c/UK114 family)